MISAKINKKLLAHNQSTSSVYNTRQRTQSESATRRNTIGSPARSANTKSLNICDVCKSDAEVKKILSKFEPNEVVENIVKLQHLNTILNDKIIEVDKLNKSLEAKISSISLLDAKMSHLLLSNTSSNDIVSNENTVTDNNNRFVEIEKGISNLNKKLDEVFEACTPKSTNIDSQVISPSLNNNNSHGTPHGPESANAHQLYPTQGNSHMLQVPGPVSDCPIGSTVTIGDSNLNKLIFGDDPASSFGKHMPGVYVKASHVSDLPRPASIIKHSNAVIHTGINSIRGRNVPSIRLLVDKIIAFCSSVHKISPNMNIYISGLLPTKSARLNKLVDVFNGSLFNVIMNIQYPLYYISHDNLRDPLTGLLDKRFGTDKMYDMVHLGDMGVRRFAQNIKHCVLPSTLYDQPNRPAPYVHHRQLPRSKPVTHYNRDINVVLDEKDMEEYRHNLAITQALKEMGASSFAEKVELVNSLNGQEIVSNSLIS